MNKKNSKYNMLHDFTEDEIHMCKINLHHTICIWGEQIFDSSFEKTLPLTPKKSLYCRSIGENNNIVQTYDTHINANDGSVYIHF